MSGHRRDRWHEFDDDDVSTFSLARPSRPPSTPPAAAGPTAADQVKDWHAYENEIQHGPLSKVDIKEMLRAGQLTEEADIWRKGHEHWLPLRAYPELRALLDPESSEGDSAGGQPSPFVAASVAATVAAAGPPSSTGSLLPLATPVDEEPNPFRKPSLIQRVRGASPWVAVVSAVVVGLMASYVLFSGGGQAVAADAESSTSRATAAPGAGDDEPSYRVQLGVSSDESRPIIKRFVEEAAAAMERDCWRSARATREVSAPANAAVPVALTVKRSGRVERALVSADPAGYPGLGSCVLRRVRDWHFDRLGEDTNVKVTFHFALSP